MTDRGTTGLDRRAFALGAAVLPLVGGAAAAQDRPPDPAAAQDPEAPLLLTNLLTRMALPVSLNGAPATPFVLDTGAGRTVVSAELAEALRLPRGPDVLVHGITAAAMAPTVRIERFDMARRRFRDLAAPVFPRAALAADGLIGLDTLARFRLTLDIAARQVDLAPSGPDVLPNGSASTNPSRLSRVGEAARRGRFGQLILLAASADGIRTEAFVDSGAQYSIGNLALLRAVGGEPTGLNPITLYGVTGQMLAAGAGQVSDLRLGRQSLGAAPLLFADLHAFRALDLVDRPALLIGADLLYRFREVTLDFGLSRMMFRGLRPPAAPRG